MNSEDFKQALADEIASLKQAMETIPTHQHSFAYTLRRKEYLLHHGQVFTPQRKPRKYKRGTPKECYHNSLRLAVENDGLVYVEGDCVVRVSSTFTTTIEHGWCATSKGLVVDVTLEPSAIFYFGVIVPLEEVSEAEELPALWRMANKASNT